MSGPSNRHGLFPLSEIPVTDSFFLGVDSTGAFSFRTDVMDKGTGTQGDQDHRVEERQLVAMGLTEVCSRNGRGKVFYFPMPWRIMGRERVAVADREKNACIYHRLPKLIYVPFAWSDEDQHTWREMKHQDRLRLLNARAGGVSREECVMPVDLVYGPYDQERIRLNAYNSRDRGCQATLVMVSKAYVGWCHQLQGPDPEVNLVKGNWAAGGEAFVVATDASLKEHQCQDGDSLVQRLKEMYFAGEPRSLAKFGDILSAVDMYHSQDTKGARKRK